MASIDDASLLKFDKGELLGLIADEVRKQTDARLTGTVAASVSHGPTNLLGTLHCWPTVRTVAALPTPVAPVATLAPRHAAYATAKTIRDGWWRKIALECSCEAINPPHAKFCRECGSEFY